MISNQIGFYANTSQRPFLKEIGLMLNNKIREWIKKVSLRRPESAEQAQFFSVFQSNGGKREATMKCESRSRRSEKKNTRKNTCNPQNRRNVLRFSDKQRQEGSEHEE